MRRIISRFAVLTVPVLALTISGCQGKMNRPEPGVTAQGCVRQKDGSYHLVDGFGHDYVLSGELADIKQNVGHEMLIRGSRVQDKQTPQGQPQASEGVVSRVDVTSAKVVSDKCSTTTGSSK